ncbi:MAG: amino acid permease [Kordiimonadaceae bacterium]|nr:amino acid permease [Kordiimonadaceae bacterium]
MSLNLPENKTIGLWGIVFTITGFVVGVSIFILPANLIEIAGPAVLLAYAIAGAMAIVTCFATAQIGTLMPAEGGTYVAISKLMSPYFGFLAVFVLLCAVILVNSFVGYGFADYIVYFFPGLNKKLAATAVVLFFGLVNISGSDLVIKFQGVMVILFLIMLSIFILNGLPHFEKNNLKPFMQNGVGAVFEAAALGYFSFAGFISLLEFGGEIKKPSVNIPAGLAISFLIVFASYGGVSLVLSGINTVENFEGMVTPVLEVARTFLPKWLISALVLSIIAAAATTINGLILGYSRDIFVIAEAGIFPNILARRSKKYNTPINAIIAYTFLSIAAIQTGSDITNFALVAVMGLLIQQLFIAISLYRVPAVMGIDYEKAEFKLKKWVINLVSILLFVISAGFIAKMVFDKPAFGLIILAVLGLGSLYYFAILNKRNRQ